MQAANAWPPSACAPAALAAQLARGGEPAAQRLLGAYLRCRQAAQSSGGDLGLWLGSGLEQAVAEVRQALAEAAARKAVPAGRASLSHLASMSGSWDGDAADAAAAAAAAAAACEAAGTSEGTAEAAAADVMGAPAASAAALGEVAAAAAGRPGMLSPALQSLAGQQKAEAPEASGAAVPDAASEEDLRRLMREALVLFETPATPLGSFHAIFAAQLALGTISRRRLYAAAQEARPA